MFISFVSFALNKYEYTQLVYRNVKGAETRYSYDLADRMKEVYQPDGNVISYHYDKDGNLSLYKDRDSQIYARYNIFGDVVSRNDGKGTLHFNYDKEGRLIAITNQDDKKYLLHRDAEGDVRREIGFDGIKRDYIRDYTGRVNDLRVGLFLH